MDSIRRRASPSSSTDSSSTASNETKSTSLDRIRTQRLKEMALKKKQWRDLRQWYFGDKDLPFKERLYFGSRLSWPFFIGLHVLVLLSFIIAIVLSILYFAVAPRLIQNAFNGLNGPDAPGLDLVRVLNMSDTTAEVLFDGTIRGGVSSIPINVRGPVNISLYYGDSAIASLIIDNGIPLNKFTTGAPGRLTVVNLDVARKALGCNGSSSSSSSTPNAASSSSCLPFTMQSDLDVEILGSLWYRGFHVTSSMNLKSTTSSQSAPGATSGNGNVINNDTSKTGSSNSVVASNKVNEAIPALIRAPSINDEIKKLPGSENLLNLGPGLPLIKLESAKVDSISPTRATVTLGVSLENPTVLEVPVKSLRVGFGMRRDTQMLIQIESGAEDGSPLTLKKGLNSFRVRASVNYTVDSLGSLSGSNNYVFGPLSVVSMQDKDFIGNITPELAIPVKADLATAIATFGLKNILSIRDPFAALDPKNPNSPFNPNNPLNPFRPGNPLADLTGLLTNRPQAPTPADLLAPMKLLAALAPEV